MTATHRDLLVDNEEIVRASPGVPGTPVLLLQEHDTHSLVNHQDESTIRIVVPPGMHQYHRASFASYYRNHCLYLPAMAGWFLFSALLTSYNKYIFGVQHFHFPCPLLMTSIHFGTQWLVSEGLCRAFPRTFGNERIVQMTWKEFLSVSIPCGCITSGDVGLSNLAIQYITISFYTMVKASTPVFVLMWAWIFQIERITPTLVAVVFIIGAGELLTVSGGTDDNDQSFQINGLLLCLGASMLSGMRWTLIQLRLQSLQPPLKTTIATLRVLSPSMFFSLLTISLLTERPWTHGILQSVPHSFQLLGLALVGAFLAIAMILCEFSLIMQANAIVLMIGGVIKELVSIFVGVTFFHDRLNLQNIIGFMVVFSGVIVYKISFHLKKDHGLSHLPDRHQPLPVHDDDDDDGGMDPANQENYYHDNPDLDESHSSSHNDIGMTRIQ